MCVGLKLLSKRIKVVLEFQEGEGESNLNLKFRNFLLRRSRVIQQGEMSDKTNRALVSQRIWTAKFVVAQIKAIGASVDFKRPIESFVGRSINDAILRDVLQVGTKDTSCLVFDCSKVD